MAVRFPLGPLRGHVVGTRDSEPLGGASLVVQQDLDLIKEPRPALLHQLDVLRVENGVLEPNSCAHSRGQGSNTHLCPSLVTGTFDASALPFVLLYFVFQIFFVQKQCACIGDGHTHCGDNLTPSYVPLQGRACTGDPEAAPESTHG